MTSYRPVARTAFYCCAIRADDAAKARPICGDSFAQRFVDSEIRKELQPLLALSQPAAANVARHHLFDELIGQRLAENPQCRIFVLGAGFDTRAFRLKGGLWWEIDDPDLLDFKQERLPASQAPNPLSRVPIVFQSQALSERLAPFAGDDRAIVILEGVSMYLDDATLGKLASDVRHAFPRATLICDLMSPAFAKRFSAKLRGELGKMGAMFGQRSEHPRFAIQAAGYVVSAMKSIIGHAVDVGAMWAPRWLLATFLRELRDGYAVWTFEPKV